MKSDGAHRQVVGHREAVELAMEEADLDRRARQHLVLHRHAPVPVRRPHAPARAGCPGSMVLLKVDGAEVQVADDAAEVAGRTEVLRLRVAEVAVGIPVAVAVGPGARDVGGDARRRVARGRSSTR